MFLAVSSTSSGQAALVVQDSVGAAAAVTVVAACGAIQHTLLGAARDGAISRVKAPNSIAWRPGRIIPMVWPLFCFCLLLIPNLNLSPCGDPFVLLSF